MKQKRIIFTLILALMLALNCVTSFAVATPIKASIMSASGQSGVSAMGTEGTWYIGATPPNCDYNKPVIVFVQGLHGKASDWWGPTVYHGTNDMYNYAYNSGYRTAFVDFVDAEGGGAGDMWRNGSVLRNQLQSICSYFGVKKVNIVCHSKGGIDTQTAIVHYGAYPYVDKVFTLSTPHWGSQLADLSYGTYTWWLGAILGQQDDGTYVLQTGYMSYFRSITDNRSENNTITYYTSAGTSWGPFLSALACGGAYLAVYDSNDGLVTVTSAHNPRATHIYTGDYDHDNIRMGSKSWWYVEPRIRTFTAGALASQPLELPATTSAIETSNSSNSLLRGGKIEKTEAVTVPVDSSSTSVMFDLLVADPGVTVKVVSPDGAEYTSNATVKDTEYFSGATHLVTKLDNPKSGYWTIKIDSEKKNAYFLITSFNSPLQTDLSTDKIYAKTGDKLTLDINLKGDLDKRLIRSSTSANICKVVNRGQINKVQDFAISPVNNKIQKEVTMPQEAGLYNFNIEVKGLLDDGSPFERTIVKSIMVESDSKTKLENLKSVTGK